MTKPTNCYEKSEQDLLKGERENLLKDVQASIKELESLEKALDKQILKNLITIALFVVFLFLLIGVQP